MGAEPVTSPRNRRVVAASRLRRARDRRETGLTLLEGPELLQEAVHAGADLVDVFALETDDRSKELCGRHGLPITVLSAAALDRLAPTTSPRGPVAVLRIPAPAELTGDRLVLEVSDPGNAGTLIRSAAAFGLAVAMDAGAVDPWAPKTLRSGAGAHFRTSIGNWAPGSDATVGTIATVVSGGIPPDTLGDVLAVERRWAVLVGAESAGLDEASSAAADVRVTIPMPGGTESLNAAVAGSIVAYELSRWRRSSVPRVQGGP